MSVQLRTDLARLLSHSFLENVTFYDDVVVILNVLGRHGWELISSSTEKDGLKGQQFTFKKLADD